MNIPDSGRNIVINGLITTDTLLNVRLSKSAYVTDLNASLCTLDILNDANVYFYQNSIIIDSLYYWKFR